MVVETEFNLRPPGYEELPQIGKFLKWPKMKVIRGYFGIKSRMIPTVPKIVALALGSNWGQNFFEQKIKTFLPAFGIVEIGLYNTAVNRSSYNV